MSGVLEDRVCCYIHDHPGSTVAQVARALRARDKTVRSILQSPLFAFSATGKVRGYFLRSQVRAGQGRPSGAKPETDGAYLLRLLGDGREHSLGEILRRSTADRGHGFTVHSRAAELRAAGHRVVNRTVAGAARGENSVYMLLDSAPADAPERDLSGGAESSGPAAPAGASELTAGAAQLSMTGGAFRKQAAA